MRSYFTPLDWSVLIVYFVGVLALGMYFWRRTRSSDQFTAGGRSLPGWLCGLSIFATYLSSISYLALPGKSFVDNWNPFIFSLSIPIAAWVAAIWFIPYYRNSREVSAYAMLEKRFGPWARVYASTFFLLFHIARMGLVLYLMALPMSVIFGWDIRVVIAITGISVTAYSFVGGIVAVIWADAIQAVVLLVGAVVALWVLLAGLPDGPGQVFNIAARDHKFSVGSFNIADVTSSTVWIVLVYGLMENVKNFGIDQSFIQRYIASSSDAEARRGIWIGGLLYIPVSALFFFIGTSLYAFYEARPENLVEVRHIVARQKLMQQGIPEAYIRGENGEARLDPDYALRLETLAESLPAKAIGDRVFPHFIAAHLSPGVTGLLVAAIFAAAMSTVSTSLNSSATLVMSDFYQRFVLPEAEDRQLMRVLYCATILWGTFGTLMALGLIWMTESALDIWWTMSGVLGAGILGLFLLGMLTHRVGNRAAILAVAAGSLLILWMIVSPTELWPAGLDSYRSPFNNLLVIVFGTLTILATGFIASRYLPRVNLTR